MKALFKKMALLAGAHLLRHVSAFPGRYRITSALLPWLRQVGVDMGVRQIRTRHGFKFNADLADWLGQYVYLNGVYEPPTAQLFVELIQPGNTVLDVGANVGFFSLLSAAMVGAEGRVFAFEPVPAVKHSLVSNIAINNYYNITVVPKAASDCAAMLTIYEGPEGHKGVSSLRPIESASQSLTIAAVAIDDMAQEIGTVDFIKIDVEGAELLALKGMQGIVNRDRPLLIIEFTDAYLKSFGHTAKQMAEWLQIYGYQLYRIEERGLIPLDYSSADVLPEQFNVLACQKLPSVLVGKLWLN